MVVKYRTTDRSIALPGGVWLQSPNNALVKGGTAKPWPQNTTKLKYTSANKQAVQNGSVNTVVSGHF